jgi:hypothetical protein
MKKSQRKLRHTQTMSKIKINIFRLESDISNGPPHNKDSDSFSDDSSTPLTSKQRQSNDRLSILDEVMEQNTTAHVPMSLNLDNFILATDITSDMIQTSIKTTSKTLSKTLNRDPFSRFRPAPPKKPEVRLKSKYEHVGSRFMLNLDKYRLKTVKSEQCLTISDQLETVLTKQPLSAYRKSVEQSLKVYNVRRTSSAILSRLQISPPPTQPTLATLPSKARILTKPTP